MTEPVLAWHFVGKKLRNGDLIPDDGVPLIFDGKLSICQSGLHAAEKIFGALCYAPGNTICRVECNKIGERHDDKFVCASRTILWRIDGEQILRRFAKRVALDVINLWNAPPIVRQYLETDDETIRDAAVNAARYAAGAAAGAATWAAAWATAWAAAWAAAGDAAGAAAWAGAGDAAGDAAITKYNDWLTEMVETAHANR